MRDLAFLDTAASCAEVVTPSTGRDFMRLAARLGFASVVVVLFVACMCRHHVCTYWVAMPMSHTGVYLCRCVL